MQNLVTDTRERNCYEQHTGINTLKLGWEDRKCSLGKEASSNLFF